MIRWYVRTLHRYPCRTKVISGGLIVGLGDVVAQQAIECRGMAKHDLDRTLRLTAVGMTLIAPFNYTWLDKVLPRVTAFKGKATKHALVKVALDQSISAPIACTAYIFGNALTSQGFENLMSGPYRDNVLKWKSWEIIHLLTVGSTSNAARCAHRVERCA